MNTDKIQRISWKGSLFLDSLRLLSALIVLYIHAHDLWFPFEVQSSKLPGDKAHGAVIIFFVLSGYVIAHTTTANNRGRIQYVVARLSRLYSVVFPALVITALIQLIVNYTNPSLGQEFSRGLSLPRYVITSSFLNEVWFLSAAPPINRPLWSLSFEFWYYTIFGFWFFKPHTRKSFIYLVIICLIAGPKILLMMPIWLAGYTAYRTAKPDLSATVSWILCFASISFAIGCIAFLHPLPFNIGEKPFFFANQFITDWTVGVFIAGALWFLPDGSLRTERPPSVEKFRRIADLTFPIYALHYPFLVLFIAGKYFKSNNTAQMWEGIIIVLIVSSILGALLEKQRYKWLLFFQQVIIFIKFKLRKFNLS